MSSTTGQAERQNRQEYIYFMGSMMVCFACNFKTIVLDSKKYFF